MSLELIARLERKLPVQRGSSARGAWSKQEFVVQTEDVYPKKVCMSVWGDDKIQELENIREGEKVKISFNLESREYNQKWYTDVRAWKMVKYEDTVQPVHENQDEMIPKPMINVDDMESDDDLPF